MTYIALAMKNPFTCAVWSSLILIAAGSVAHADTSAEAYRAMGIKPADVLTGTVLTAKVLPGADKQVVAVTTYFTGSKEREDAVNVRLDVFNRTGDSLALVYERATGTPPTGIAIVGVLAVVNGALIQIIMASRVLYGLAARRHLPAGLARVHSRTGTPHYATFTAGAFVLLLALGFPLAPLAEGTSVATLIVFASVNLALWRIKGRARAVEPAFAIPRWVPAVGFCTTSGLLLLRLGEVMFF